MWDWLAKFHKLVVGHRAVATGHRAVLCGVAGKVVEEERQC